jgi:lysophospholipase L1-like esterase
MKSVILIGDSIRMGYQPTVEKLFGNQAQLWAPKENGGTSANVLAHLDEWVLSRRPDIVHLNCGLHDLKTEFGAASQAVPLGEYKANLQQIIGRIVEQGAIQLIWAATTPVNQVWHHARKPFDRSEADVLAYNAVAQQVAAAYHVPVNDLYQVIVSAGRDQLLTPDGVHLSPAGYTLLGQAVADAIRPYL